MKKFICTLFTILIVTTAQTDSTQIKIESAVQNIIELSKNRDFVGACDFIAYTGVEESRKFNDKLNSKVSREVESAERILKKIKAYLDISDSYELGNIKTKSKKDHEFEVADIIFKSGKQTLKIEFEFIKVNKKYLLAAIE